MTKKHHTLTRSEIVNVLINQNLGKYRKFIFTKRQAILDSCWTCFIKLKCCRNIRKSRKREKFHILYKSGAERLSQWLDIRSIVRSQQTLHNVIKLLLDKQGRQLLRFQRRNILEFGGSASDTTDTEAE